MGYKKSVYKTFTLITQLGISMIVPVFLCTWLGVYLEEKYSVPVTIPLIILGILAGGRNIYVLVRHANEDRRMRNMKKDNTLTELVLGIILLGVIEQIVCLIFLKDYLYNAVGLWSGILVAVGMAVHMKRSIEDALDFGRRCGKAYSEVLCSAYDSGFPCNGSCHLF